MSVSMSGLVTQWGKGNSLSAYLSLPCHPNGTLSPASLPISMSSFANQYATIQAGGGVVTTLAGSPTVGAGGRGSTDGVGTNAKFNFPFGVAVDSSGNVYVADSENNSIRKITPGALVSTFATGFNSPSGVAVDSSGNVYVADTANGSAKKITPGGTVSVLATGIGYPYGIAVDSSGNVYVADYSNAIVKKITPAGAVSTFATVSSSPTGVAVDSAGYVYVSSGSGVVNKITPGGSVSNLATGITSIFAIAVDTAGYVYVTNGVLMCKITPDGVVSNLAGGVAGRTDGVGGNARFSANSFGIAVDTTRNLYIGDTGNSLIRKIT